jgi:hypothetical protein
LSQRQKLIDQIKSNPKDVSFEELHKYLVLNGATWREAKGSHRYYSLNGQTLAVPRKNPIKAIYVNKAINMIEGEEN